jgi:hypothetical protein
MRVHTPNGNGTATPVLRDNPRERAHRQFLRETVSYLLFYYDEIVLQVTHVDGDRGKEPHAWQLDELKKHCRGGIPTHIKVKGRSLKVPYYNSYQRWWVLPIVMPTPEAINLMIQWGWRVKFWKIEFACDHATKNQHDADVINAWMKDHTYFKGNRSPYKEFKTGGFCIGDVKRYGGTSFTGYADKRKIAKHAFHSEIRMYTHRKIRELTGINTLKDLLNFDIRNWMLNPDNTKQRFSDVNRYKLRRAKQRKGRNRGNRREPNSMQGLIKEVGYSRTYMEDFDPGLHELSFKDWTSLKGFDRVYESGTNKKREISVQDNGKVEVLRRGDFNKANVNTGGPNPRPIKVRRPPGYKAWFKHPRLRGQSEDITSN